MASAIGGGACIPNANSEKRWNLTSLRAALPSLPLNIHSSTRIRSFRLPVPQYNLPFYKLSRSHCKPQAFLNFIGLCPSNPVISLGDCSSYEDNFPILLNGDRVLNMRHRKRKNHLNRSQPSRRALLRHLTTEVLKYGRIKTTIARAKALRTTVDKMITLAKDGSIEKRRMALGFIYDKNIVHSLFAEAPQRYGDRPGGYTRVLKTFTRKGDGAPMAYIELV